MIISAYFRLLRAGYVLAREGALSIVTARDLPASLRLGIWFGRLIERPSVRKTGHVERLNKALNMLGPTYRQVRPDPGHPPRCGGGADRQ